MALDLRLGDGLRLGAERVERRGHQHHLDAPEGAHREVAPRWRVARGPDREVGAPGGQRVPGAAQDLVAQAQPRAAVVLVEFADHPVEPGDGDHRVHGDAQLGLPAVGHLAHAAFEVRGGAQQAPALGE